jgi:hypothetical protein
MWGVVGDPGAVSPVPAANTRLAVFLLRLSHVPAANTRLAVFLLCLSLAAAARRTPRPTPYPVPPTTTSTYHVGFRQIIVLAFSKNVLCQTYFYEDLNTVYVFFH